MTISATADQSRLRVAETGVIYRNPLPGHQALAATHPFICALSETELLVSYRVGQAQYSRDNMIHLSRSMDGGRTWCHEGAFRDRGKDRRPYQYSPGGFTLLRDGTLVMNNWRCDRSDPDKLYVDPQSGGALPLDLCFFRSHDGGRSWSEPVVGETPPAAPGLTHAWGGPVIELDSGAWMQLAEPWIAYGSTREFEVRTYVMFSNDQGHTWGNETDIANGIAEDRGYSHGHIARLPDGRFMVLCWTMNNAMTEFYDLSLARSADATAQTWTAPQRTGIPGQSSYPVVIDERRIAVIYSQRDGGRPGINVVLSHDGGQTWDLDRQVMVWDAYGKEALGVPATDTYPGSHDAIAYGGPHLAKVDDRTLIASFWCTQSADTHVRFARVIID